MNHASRRWLTLICSGLLVAAPLLADPGAPDNREMLQAAIAAFESAAAKSRTDPAAAKSLYDDAAAKFQSLIAADVRSSGIEYNLGNTFYRLGDIGRAVVHLRRAERLSPDDSDIQANLRYIRDQVEPRFAPDSSFPARAWSTIVAGGGRLAAVGAAAWALAWTLLIVRRFRTQLGPPAVIIVALILGGALLAIPAYARHADSSRPAAVIISGGQTPRLGRGETYGPAINRALDAGVEVRIMELRGDWAEIMLPDGKRGWLPASAVERI